MITMLTGFIATLLLMTLFNEVKEWVRCKFFDCRSYNPKINIISKTEQEQLEKLRRIVYE